MLVEKTLFGKTLEIKTKKSVRAYAIGRHEGKWGIAYVKKSGNETYNLFYPFTYPITYPIHELSWRFDLFFQKLTGKNPIKCEGCGEGVARWRIANPNNPEFWTKEKGKYWRVCNDCVDFYDRKYTKRPLVRK